MPTPYHLFSLWLPFIFAAGLVAGFTTPLTQRWEGKIVKHSWNAVPQYWESLGHPPANSTIDLYFSLKPQHENALSDTFHQVSDPRHAKYVPRHPSAATRMHEPICVTVPLQIRRIYFQEADR